MSDKKTNEKSNSHIEKNALEWSVFAVSLLLVLASIGYLIRQILVADNTPPHITLQLGTPQDLQNSDKKEKTFMVPVKALNKGGQTAEGVHLEIEMQRGQEKPQTADFEINFLPAGSSRDGWVAFQGTKDNAKLKARVLGYEIP